MSENNGDSLFNLPGEPPRPPAPQEPSSRFIMPGRAEQPPAKKEPRPDEQEAPDGTQWLTKWKGRKYWTKKAVLNAACQGCGRRYQISGGALNDFAVPPGKLDRFLDVANLWANTDKNGNAAKQLQYNREKAEVDAKQATRLAARERTRTACVCPGCGSDQVLVESPK